MILVGRGNILNLSHKANPCEHTCDMQHLRYFPPHLLLQIYFYIYLLSLLSFFFGIVLADANFPASSICACGPTEIRADGKHFFPNCCSVHIESHDLSGTI